MNPDLNDTNGRNYSDLFAFWRENLPLFNLLIIGIGVITAALLGYTYLFWDELISSLIWIIISNLLFLSHFVTDLFVIRISGGQKSLSESRETYFWIFSLFWALMTVVTVNISPFLF